MRSMWAMTGGWLAAAATFCVGFCHVATAQAAPFSFADIQNWVGTGSNESAMVIDFQDGLEPLVWGFRHEDADEATGEDMFRAIVLADDNLFGRISTAFEQSFGNFVTGIGYDRDGDGFAVTPAYDFGPGGLDVSPSLGSTETSVDPDDSYWGAFNLQTFAFWNYFHEATETIEGVPTTAGANPYAVNGGWVSSEVGFTSRPLYDGSWDGWSYSSNATPPGEPPVDVAAVPEPATLTMMLAGGALGAPWALRLRRRRSVGSDSAG